LIGTGTEQTPDLARVQYDTLINDQSVNVDFDFTDYVFEVAEVGTYLVQWWASTDGSGASPIIQFGVAVNFGDATQRINEGCSPIVTGQVSGMTLVTITGADLVFPGVLFPGNVAHIGIRNFSGDTVNYGATFWHSQCTIIEVSV
jgi:hypothetical protein